MGSKVKGGLGKTARSSTQFNRKAGPSGHVCEACGGAIIVKDYLPVRRDGKMVHYHAACWVSGVPAGPSAKESHPEVRGPQVAGVPNIIKQGRGWGTKLGSRLQGWASLTNARAA